MPADKSEITIGTMVKIGIVVVPLFTTAAVALYRVGEAETRIDDVAVELDEEITTQAAAMEKIHTGQMQIMENLTDIRIKVGVLCQATEGARCP